MEAGSQLRRFSVRVLSVCLIAAGFQACEAAGMRTQNFIVQAPTPGLAEAVGQAAERYRHDLAVHWLGKPLPHWPSPCPVRVIAGPNLAAQGVTTYNPAPVRDFQMEVVGTPERILDSVLPHEVTHTILATYFGRPLPRWADEGICTTVEHASERSKHDVKLLEFLRSRRGIAMNQLFLMTEYPADVLPMYAQGYSVCRFLIDQKGPHTFIQFLQDYMQRPSWTANVKKHYQYDSLAELQQYWLAWVTAGSGSVEKFAKVQPAPAPSVSLAALESSGGRDAATPLALTAPQQARDPVVQADASLLASTTSQGWYQRKKLDARSPGTLEPVAAAAAPTMTAIPRMPPSVRNSGPYQSAHPQAEQQISRGGARFSAIPDGPQFR
jgi:hypothetical protein